MTREQFIEAMARAIDPDAWDPDAKAYGKDARRKASLVVAEDVLDALLPHIQAERERVREMCAAFCASKSKDFKDSADEEPDTVVEDKLREIGKVAAWLARDIRALDIGGQDD